VNQELKRILKRFFKDPSAVLGLSLVLFFTVVAILAPVIAPPVHPLTRMKLPDPYLMPVVSWDQSPQPPTTKEDAIAKNPNREPIRGVDYHPFGVIGGRDIFYGVVWGTRTAFKIGIIVTLARLLIGILIGSISGYFGGWIDELLMRITDVFLSIPFLIAAVVLTTVLGTGLDKVMIAMIVFGWMGAARLIRGNILQVREEQYVLAAKAIGVPDFLIILKHVLPNSIFPVLIWASMNMGSLVITAAVLSFLGLGAPQGYADWGSILSYSRDWMMEIGKHWYALVYPGTAMVLFVLGWNLLGDALRDAFDPRLKF
jgi:peptide/nickel transport system permease protein